MYAELVVFNENCFDPRAVPDEKIKDVHPVLTVVNGRIAHDDLDHKRKKYWNRHWRGEHRGRW